MRANKKPPLKAEKKTATPSQKRGGLSYSRNTALLEEAITQMNAGKYGRSSAALKELLGLDPHNMEARRLFATLHLRLGSLIPARQAFASLINEALERQDYWLAESLLREYLAAGPRCVPFLEKLGGLYEEKGDALEAVTEYGKAIDILIEDPDPEHPHRAEELFAKIRELAPASPVAFRLSAFFDAQTGALMARPMAALTSESMSESASVEPGDGTPEAAAPSGEPMTGIMSWDQVVDSSTTWPASTAADSPVSAGLAEEPFSVPEGCVADALTGRVVETPVVSVEPSFLEPCERIFDVANTASSPAEDVQAVQPLQFIADQSIADGIPENLIARAEPPPVLPSGLNAQPEMIPVIEENHPVTLQSADEAKTTIESDASSLPWEPVQATAVPVETVGRSPAEPEPPGADARLLSSPLPWEQVQDAVHIPDPFPSQLLSDPEPTNTSPVEPPLESEASRDDTQQRYAASESEVALTPLCQTEQEAPVPPLSKEIPGASATETGVAPPVAAPSAPPADLESAKKTAFSWKAVFSRGWKAADYSPARVLSPEPVPYKVPPNHASLNAPPEAVSCDTKELASVPLAPAEPTTRSMSVEEVQQVVAEAFTIESEATVAPTNADAVVGLPTAAEQVQDRSGLETLHILDAATDVTSLSAADAPAVPMLSEFHLLAGDADSSVEPPASRQSETSIPSGTPEKDTTDALTAIAPLPQSLVEATAETTEPEPTAPSCSLEASGGHTPLMPQPARDSWPLDEVLPFASIAAEPVLQGDESTSEPFTIFAEEPGAATDRGVGAPASAMSVKEPGAIPEAAVYVTPEPASDPEVSRGTAETVLPSGNASSDSPPVPATLGDSSDWKPAEVAIQVHRPSPPEGEPVAFGHEHPPVPSPREEATAPKSADQPGAAALDGESKVGISEPPAAKDEWIRTGESIRLTEPLVVVAQPDSETPVHDEARALQPVSTAAAAVEALFASSGRFPKTESHEAAPVRRPGRRFSAKLARLRRAISIFVASCFSTTRAMLMSLLALLVLLSLFGAMGLGIVAVTWMVMEEPPSSAFHNLTTMPPRTLSDARNGYVLLLGFDAPLGQDSTPPASHQELGRKDRKMVAGCLDGPVQAGSGQTMASANAANELFRGRDPLARIKSHADTIKRWSGQSLLALARYTQWLKSPFEDGGYGQSVRLPCAAIVFTHQLYVAEGFVLGTDAGIDRLEADMEAWRTVLVQATTLPVKAMAIGIVEDDAAVASQLLAKPDSEAKMLERLTRMARPLNQAESSIRWPMQSELVWASKNLEGQLQAERAEGLPVHAAIASMLPLPKQRRLNQYAEYYDAASKVSGEGRYRSIPKRSQYIRVPANGLIDYLGNPIENIVGLEPLPEWNRYTARIGDLDAHLRLLSLQAWLRRGSQEADLLARIAKAGQDFYDPYTGFPMLVNQKKGLLYSVGHDGRDQDADPETDIVVAIPATQASGSTKSAANSLRDQ